MKLKLKLKLREIRILHIGGYWLKFAEVSTRDVGLLLYSRGHWKLYKPRDTKPGELTWWRFLEMGSSGGENRQSRACYGTLRDYLDTGANSGDEPRIVWTVLLISLEPNHAT